MRPTVLLFDIDGTLISTDGAGRRAMEGAFIEVCGTADGCTGFAFNGMTDRAIVRQGISSLDLTVTEDAIDQVLEAYLARLADEVSRSGGYRVMPGVSELIAWLRTQSDVAIGLGTGNVRAGAYTKLARGSLDVEFPFGGFGCDAEDRVELLRAGARRGAAALGVATESCRVVVIGDTPRDIAAAKGARAVAIGVGTGGTAPEKLTELGAHHAFATLEDEGVRTALLG